MVTEDGYQSLNKSRKMRNKWQVAEGGRLLAGQRREPDGT